MTNSELQRSIKNYEDALREITESLAKNDTQMDLLEEKVLRVLMTRDIVQTHLISVASISVYDLKKICTLDDWSGSIKEAVVKTKKLEKWQKTLKPTPESWWWFLKAPTHSLDRLDWAWSGLSFFFLLISFGLCTNIATRFFTGGSDPVGITLIAAQSVLGFLSAKGSIPSAWQEKVQKAIEATRLPKQWRQALRFVLSLIFLAFSISIYSALPLFSNLYFWWGKQEKNTPGRLENVKNNYSRAILLNPENTAAHYNLGGVYERMQMIDLARSEYKIATSQGGDSYAYSNLARLEILDKKYSLAVALVAEGLKNLDKGEPDEATRKLIEYPLHKNLGWARLGQERYEEAQKSLTKAINLNPEKASAHCLIAQVFEAEEKSKEALFHWKKCIQLAENEINQRGDTRFPIDEDGWLGQANRCLNPKYRKKGCLEKK